MQRALLSATEDGLSTTLLFDKWKSDFITIEGMLVSYIAGLHT